MNQCESIVGLGVPLLADLADSLPCQPAPTGKMIEFVGDSTPHQVKLAQAPSPVRQSGMLEFTDAPYKFFPAKPNSFVLWLGRLLNQRRNLPSHRHLISEVEIRGKERLSEARRLGERRLFFLANHSTHSDAQILNEAQRQLGVRSCYMAAYDVFLRGKLQAWVMQHAGCFSVNRDASDSRSMREAIRLLTDNRYGLTLFPEGNVYLMNDRVTPFLDGAAFIGMKAQKQLGIEVPIFVIPTSIKATHLTDQREAIRAKLTQVATDIGLELDSTAPMLDEIKRVGLSALERSLKQRGLIPDIPDGLPLRAHLEHCAEHMTKGLEDKIGLPTKERTPLNQRIRKVRSRIHKVRADPEAKADHQVAASWADEAMIALRILSYAGDYVESNPSLDRCGESVENLLEDIYSQVQAPYGERRAIVEFGEPINLNERLDDYGSNARESVSELTALAEARIQAGLDAINTANAVEGTKLF